MTKSLVKSVVQRLVSWRGRAAIALLPMLVALVLSTLALAYADVAPTSQGNAMARPYQSVTIGQPAANATIFAGNVEVAIVTSPVLRPGDRIALDIDGHPMPPRSQERFELSNLERGEHTLRVRVIDANGDILISSRLVIFYVWRGSLLFPNRRKS